MFMEYDGYNGDRMVYSWKYDGYDNGDSMEYTLW